MGGAGSVYIAAGFRVVGVAIWTKEWKCQNVEGSAGPGVGGGWG